MTDVERAREMLIAAPVVHLGYGYVWTEDRDGSGLEREEMLYARDLRGRSIPERPEIFCFIADALPGPDGRGKVVCQSGTPEQIRAFCEQWAPSQGLVDVYGDPARGIAGGYLP